MRSRWSIGHLPGALATIVECTGQVHTVSSRTGTSFILQIGQSPGDASTTSGCIGQVIETGGTLAGEAVLPRCAPRVDVTADANHTATIAHRNAFRPAALSNIRASPIVLV